MTEALVNGTPCFLAEEAWQRVFRSAILPNELWGERTELVLSLWVHLASGPGLFKAAEEVICSPHPIVHGTIASTVDRIYRDRAALIQWYRKHEAELPPLDGSGVTDILSCNVPIFCPATVRKLQLLGTYLSCVILLSRLLIALAPTGFYALELQCQEMAQKVVRMRDQLESSKQPILCGFFITQTWWIARATIQTRDEWITCHDFVTGKTIDHRRFERWCHALGRKTAGRPSGQIDPL